MDDLTRFDNLPSHAAGGPDNRASGQGLLDVLDRVLDKGVVLSGDITLSVADVDLVYVGLRLLVSSVEAAQRMGLATGGGALK